MKAPLPLEKRHFLNNKKNLSPVDLPSLRQQENNTK